MLSTTAYKRVKLMVGLVCEGAKIIYRGFVPAMLHCLALGSITYYGLELYHARLSSRLMQQDLNAEVSRLAHELSAREPGASNEKPTSTPSKRWWWPFA